MAVDAEHVHASRPLGTTCFNVRNSVGRTYIAPKAMFVPQITPVREPCLAKLILMAKLVSEARRR